MLTQLTKHKLKPEHKINTSLHHGTRNTAAIHIPIKQATINLHN